MASYTLSVEVDDETVLNEFYKDSVNSSPNSGLKLYFPDDIHMGPKSTALINLRVKCQFKVMTPTQKVISSGVQIVPELNLSKHGYLLVPCESIGQTPLRMSASIGVIDAGYVGSLKVSLDNTSDNRYTIKRGTCLFKVCLPSLMPFDVKFEPISQTM